MITLGIADGHTASAALLDEGRLLGMVSEERFTRVKGCGGVPARSVRWLLEANGIRGADVGAVALASLVQPVFDLRSADASPLRGSIRTATRFAPAELLASDWVRERYVARYAPKRDLAPIKSLLREIGASPDAVRVIEHHTTHAATAYYPAPEYASDQRVLLFTVDGSGDGISATVSIGERGRMTRLRALSSYHSIGDFYMRLTQYLAMKPMEHEYKVMGLAPYAPPEWAEKAYKVMQPFYGLTADGLGFENRTGRWGLDLVPFLEGQMRGHRFDCVAAAGQRLVESTVIPWMRNWIAHTGIRTIGCAGGVFMNVKMNMLVSQMAEVESAFFMPSGGDESTAYGAALVVYADAMHARGATAEPQALGSLYLGSAHDDAACADELDRRRDEVEWIRPDNLPAMGAQLLENNFILARMAGQMEFGARSLGNRTIIANPSDPRNVRTINRAIKMRDFWMPFCPTVLHERRHDYVDNARDIPARYMINAFPSTALAFRELVCGLHPFDLTCRPQFITREENAGFYDLIKAFEARTGIGGVLNTSFNLHGEPIVESPADAVSTLLRSEIDYLLLGPFVVWVRGKRESPNRFAAAS